MVLQHKGAAEIMTMIKANELTKLQNTFFCKVGGIHRAMRLKRHTQWDFRNVLSAV